jgi:precorrin-3B C17-methyltransferase
MTEHVKVKQLNLIALSFSHHTVDDANRSCLAFSSDEKTKFEATLLSTGHARECFVLSTCNRTEIYCAVDVPVDHVVINRLQTFTADYLSFPQAKIKEMCNVYGAGILTRHLMRVACGLDSALLGEDQIQGQIREAYAQAKSEGHVGKQLETLFQAVQKCASDVRSQTCLSGTPWSVPALAVQLSMERTRAIQSTRDRVLRVLVIGASGHTGHIVIRNLISRYAGQIRIAATCRSHCASLSQLRRSCTELELVDYRERYKYANEADLIFSATRSPHLTLREDLCRGACTSDHPRVFVDLAMPFDLDDGLAKIPGSELIRLEQVKAAAAANNELRAAGAAHAEDIIERLADEYEKRRLMRLGHEDIENMLAQTGRLSDFYKPADLMRYLIYNVRDQVSSEELDVFLRCMERGFGHKALGVRRDRNSRQGHISIVGFGPGSHSQMTHQAYNALSKADYIVGYKTYIELLRPLLPGYNFVSSGMRQETERCRQALELAAQGNAVALVSSGDSGIYGMSGILLQLMHKLSYEHKITWEVVPGVTAAGAAAALLGAPLMHDFVVISLSDLLTPLDLIADRIEAAARADFVICLYNPASMKRRDHLSMAVRLISKYQNENVPAGIVTHAGRPGQNKTLTTLKKLDQEEVNMFSVVLIGNSQTYIENDVMITPRGYKIEGD